MDVLLPWSHPPSTSCTTYRAFPSLPTSTSVNMASLLPLIQGHTHYGQISFPNTIRWVPELGTHDPAQTNVQHQLRHSVEGMVPTALSYRNIHVPCFLLPHTFLFPSAVAMATPLHHPRFLLRPHWVPQMSQVASHLTTHHPALSPPSSPECDLSQGHAVSSQSEVTCHTSPAPSHPSFAYLVCATYTPVSPQLTLRAREFSRRHIPSAKNSAWHGVRHFKHNY